MTYILRLDSSSRAEGSHSRRLADMIEDRLAQTTGLTVRRRDLVAQPEAHIADATIAGFYTDPADMSDELRAATANSDALIEELTGAEALIIAAPMYNFSTPSALKAWIDQVVRINRTFSFDGTNFDGLVPTKRAFLALAFGSQGYGEGGGMASMNFLEPYLTALLGFLGIEMVRTFTVEATVGDEAYLEYQYLEASRSIENVIGGEA